MSIFAYQRTFGKKLPIFAGAVFNKYAKNGYLIKNTRVHNVTPSPPLTGGKPTTGPLLKRAGEQLQYLKEKKPYFQKNYRGYIL